MRSGWIFRLILISFILWLFSGASLLCQELPGVPDLRTVKVEELTDRQIREFMQRAEESGMTIEQLERAALSRGMPYNEIVKLRERVGELESGMEEEKPPIRKGEVLRQIREDRVSTRRDLFRMMIPEQPEEELQIFGSKLFQQENLTFAPSFNIPTPQDYQLGPGDELLIEVYGASEMTYRPVITPEGWIKIDNLAPIQLSGLTIDEASKLIKRSLTTIYRGIKGPNPNTFVVISLGDLRSITVHIAGEAMVPGTYTLPSFSTVFNALYLAGGPGDQGSFRRINVIRNNKVLVEIDLYDFLLSGIARDNIRLQDQDIVYIDEYQSRITLAGEVKRPAIYEIADDETLYDAITFAGGFSEEAYQGRINIVRNTATQRKILNVEKSDFQDIYIQNGDRIEIGKLLSRYENRVSIKGAVYREGEYELTDGMTIKDLIQKAEGLREDAFLPKASIYRLQENLKVKIIPFDLSALIMGGSEDIKLQREDMVFISSVFDLEEMYTVRISGEVNNPGTYPYYDNMDIGELIRISGGLLESAAFSRIEVARRVKDAKAIEVTSEIANVFNFVLNEDLSLSDSAGHFQLKPYDIVFIRRSPGYEKQQLVNVRGEVAFPGQYSIIRKEDRISDLVLRAGGLTEDAYAQGATLYRRIEIDEEERRRTLLRLQEESSDSIEIDIPLENEQAIGIELDRILANPHSELDLMLMEGDRLDVPKQLETVRLTGSLLYPVTVRYEPQKNLTKYISAAGGFADNALKKKTYIIYANGSVDRTHSFLLFNNYPKVEPGAEIVIPQKPERERISLQQAISISTAVSSMALVLVTLISRL